MKKNLQTLIIWIIITMGSTSIYSQCTSNDCRFFKDFSRTLLSKLKTYFINAQKISHTRITSIKNQEKQQFSFITNI
jgi:hypothetical protein